MSIRNGLFRLGHRDEGTSIIEFAILSPVLILTLFVLIQFGRMCFDLYTLQYAVDVAARTIVIDSSASLTTLTNVINGQLSVLGNPPITVKLAQETSGAIPMAKLSATMPRSYQVPLLPVYAKAVTATAYMPLPR